MVQLVGRGDFLPVYIPAAIRSPSMPWPKSPRSPAITGQVCVDQLGQRLVVAVGLLHGKGYSYQTR
jgi:hypothetical protein